MTKIVVFILIDEVVYSLLDVKHDPVPLSGIVSSIRFGLSFIF
jgi:hypothetical protein